MNKKNRLDIPLIIAIVCFIIGLIIMFSHMTYVFIDAHNTAKNCEYVVDDTITCKDIYSSFGNIRLIECSNGREYINPSSYEKVCKDD